MHLPLDAGGLLALELAAKAAVLLLLTAFAASCLRRGPARRRALLWTAGIVAVLAVPALRGVLPGWSLPGTSLPAAGPPAGMPLDLEDGAIPLAPDPRLHDALVRIATLPDPAAPEASAGRAALAGAALTLWLAGAALALLRLALGMRRLRVLARCAAPAEDPAWTALLASTSRELGLRRRCRLLVAREPISPMTWGILRPTVLLPPDCGSWCAVRRRIVLLHELVHVRRLDWLVQMLAQVACACHWFNPLAWLAARRVAVERELACDEAVVALGTRPSTYAAHLLALTRPARVGTPSVAMARRSQMEGRLMTMLRAPRPRSRLAAALVAPLLLGVGGAGLAVAAARPPAPEPPVDRAATEADRARLAELRAAAQRLLAEIDALEARLDADRASEGASRLRAEVETDAGRRILLHSIDGVVELEIEGASEARLLHLVVPGEDQAFTIHAPRRFATLTLGDRAVDLDVDDLVDLEALELDVDLDDLTKGVALRLAPEMGMFAVQMQRLATDLGDGGTLRWRGRLELGDGAGELSARLDLPGEADGERRGDVFEWLGGDATRTLRWLGRPGDVHEQAEAARRRAEQERRRAEALLRSLRAGEEADDETFDRFMERDAGARSSADRILREILEGAARRAEERIDDPETRERIRETIEQTLRRLQEQRPTEELERGDRLPAAER